MKKAFGIRSAAFDAATPMYEHDAGARGSHASRPAPRPRPHPTPALTNVIAVNVGTIADDTAIATGDPVVCGSCQAVLCHLSKVTPAGEGSFNWTCEFCGAVNGDLPLAPEETPAALAHTSTAAGVDYLLTPGTSVARTPSTGSAAGGDDADCTGVIFVCDTSGSMCISEALPHGTAARVRGGRKPDAVRVSGDAPEQYLPGEARGVVYVSRMQALQAAVAAQLDGMKRRKGNKRVGLITFATDVTLHGDCSSSSVTIAGSNLNNEAAIAAAAARVPAAGAIKDTFAGLEKRVWELAEEGSTAAGPALAAAVEIARACGAGSRIVLVTDGMSNVGVGALDGGDTQARESFYTRTAAAATAAGVAVDVIGFAGANCNMEALGRVCEATGGNLTRVSLSNITDTLTGVTDETLVATNVSIRMLAHMALELRDPLAEARGVAVPVPASTPAPYVHSRVGVVKAQTLAEDVAAGSPAVPPRGAADLTHFIGNVTRDTVHTFEYTQRSTRAGAAALRSLTHVPFQLQITYTRADGSVCMRVITHAHAITRDASAAAAHLNASPLVSHASRTVAANARVGAYEGAAAVSDVYSHFIASNVRKDDVEGQRAAGAWSEVADRFQSSVATTLSSERAKKKEASSSRRRETAPATSTPSVPPSAGSSVGGFFSRMLGGKAAAPVGAAGPAPPAAPVAAAAASSSLAAPAPPSHALSAVMESAAGLDSGVSMGDDDDEEVDDVAVSAQRVMERETDDVLAEQIFQMQRILPGSKRM